MSDVEKLAREIVPGLPDSKPDRDEWEAVCVRLITYKLTPLIEQRDAAVALLRSWRGEVAP